MNEMPKDKTRILSDRAIKIKEILPDDIGMGGFGLIELELQEYDKELQDEKGKRKKDLEEIENKLDELDLSNEHNEIVYDEIQSIISDKLQKLK